MNNMEKSLLMCDSTEGSGKAEIVMDYVMSWSLRHATEEYAKKKDLYHYCRYMLYKLLQINDPLNNIVFTEVKVWKEWQYMDLCAEVKLKNNGEDEYYALLVEDKYYSPLGYKKDSGGNVRCQVDVYKEIFEKHYNSIPEKQNYIRRYALVSCFESDDEKIKMYDEAKNYEFRVFGFYDIIDEQFWNEQAGKFKDSESEIFNEFWLRRW